MKNIILLLAISIWFFSCKKENVTPDPVVKTVTVIQHDTTYCTPLSDIIQGTWYCYKINSTTNPSSEQVNFTQTTLVWPTEFASSSVVFSSAYSSFVAQSNTFYVSVYNCSEIKIVDYSGKIYYLRRNQ